jgi:hypothetical protein
MANKQPLFVCVWIDPNDQTRAGEYLSFSEIERNNYANKRKDIGFTVSLFIREGNTLTRTP